MNWALFLGLVPLLLSFLCALFLFVATFSLWLPSCGSPRRIPLNRSTFFLAPSWGFWSSILPCQILTTAPFCNRANSVRTCRSTSTWRCSCGSGLSPSYRPRRRHGPFESLPGSESACFSLAQLSELGLIRSAAVFPARHCAAEVLPALAQSSPSWPTFSLCLRSSSFQPSASAPPGIAQALFRYHCEFLPLSATSLCSCGCAEYACLGVRTTTLNIP